MPALLPLPRAAQRRAAVPLVVDAHGHYAAPEAERLLASRPERGAEMRAFGAATGAASATRNAEVVLPAAGMRMADLSARLRDLDLMGVDHQIVAPSPNLSAYWADEALAGDLVATVNAAGAALVAGSGGRLSALALVSPQHPQRAADQLREAMAAGFKGAEISASVGTLELSDRDFDPLWSAAEDTGAVIFIHPLGSSLGTRLAPFYLSNTVGQPAETSIALSHLIFSGVLDRFPRLKLLGAHGGGYLPAYIGRSDHAWRVRLEARGCAEPPSAYLSRLWVDTVVFDPAQTRALIDRMGADRVLWGTDYPFDMGDYDPAALAEGLPETACDAVMGGNAARLFNLSIPET